MRIKHIPIVNLLLATIIGFYLPLCLVSCSRSDKKGTGQESGENTAVMKDLYWCAENGDLEGMKSFLTADNINEAGDTYPHTYPPLHLAAGGGYLNVIEYLINSGADINKIDSNLHWTPIHFAVNSGHENVVAFLIGKGAEIDIPDGRGNYPIHTAASMGHIDVIKVLLEAGAKPDQESGDPFEDRQRMMIASEVPGFSASDKYQPIHAAAAGNQPEAMKHFISLGISPDVKDGNGNNLLQYATYKWGWGEDRAEAIRLVDPGGSFEKASRACVSTEGYYIAEVMWPGQSQPTQAYIRFMPEEKVVYKGSSEVFPTSRAVVSFGLKGGTSPGEVSKWLSPANEAAEKEGNFVMGRYKVRGSDITFERSDSSNLIISFARVDDQLRISFTSLQEQFFPGTGGSTPLAAICRFVAWK